MRPISKIKEFSREERDIPIKEAIYKKNPHKEQILQYLNAFEADCAAGMLLRDEITGKDLPIGVLGFDDGAYCWDSRYIYHFERYDMELNSDFIKHVLEQVQARESMCVFELSNEQIELILYLYKNEPLVQKLMQHRSDNVFTVSVDLKIDFIDFIEDAYFIDGSENYEPTDIGYVLESIRDTIYYQTNQHR